MQPCRKHTIVHDPDMLGVPPVPIPGTDGVEVILVRRVGVAVVVDIVVIDPNADEYREDRIVRFGRACEDAPSRLV